jgi:Collagen triple helix repeat (20 copies)
MSSTDDRGPIGPQGEVGSTGPQGETGVAGRQGEAGVSGRQGEAGHIGHAGWTGEQGVQGEAGETGAAGARGVRGHAGPGLTRRQLVAGFALVLFVFVVLSFRQEVQQRSISHNQQMIRHNQEVTDQRMYRQCVALNAGTTRQNGLIDAAIAAEKRRPQPDLQRISDLSRFKLALLDCGPPK